VAPAAAAGHVFGVAEYNAANGALVTVARGPGFVLPVTTGAAIAAGDEVEVGAGSLAVPLAAGIAVGRCLTGAAAGADAEITLYR
jgi:predicted RecA/RadA family phage recombinase